MKTTKTTKYTLVKNCKMLREDSHPTELRDILIAHTDCGNFIQKIESEILPGKLDAPISICPAKSLLALPAFLDMHVHLREPGFAYKEDIASGTAAAAAGGCAALLAMPNTRPVCDSPEVVHYILNKAAAVASCTVYTTAAITKGLAGRELVDFDALAEAGASAFTDDGRPVTSSALMMDAMKHCAARDRLIISHSEDLSLAEGGAVNDGPVARHLKVKGIPNAAEDIMIARELILAEETGCRLHIAHVSTRGGLELIRRAKQRGVRVTCETCPHYFAMTDSDVVFYGTNAKMNPPLRSELDRQAVIEAIIDGTIDCISTDHAPHSPTEKNQPLAQAPNGIIGLQTAFSAGITYLVVPGHITLARLVELMTTSPAAILRAPDYTGKIEVGGRANFCLVDPDEEYILAQNMIKSKSNNTPFMGLTLRGVVHKTFNAFTK